MYKNNDAFKQTDPQLGQDAQKELQDRFNKPNDKDDATAVDEDKKKEPEKKKEKPQ